MLLSLEYIESMVTDKEIFSNWLKDVVKMKGVVKGKNLAADVGVAPGTISGWFGDKSRGPEPDVCKKICEVLTNKYKYQSDYDEIIEAGRRQENAPSPTQDIHQIVREEVKAQLSPAPKNDIAEAYRRRNQPHHDVIDQFKNSEKAYLINKDLLELEKLSPESLEDVHDQVRFKLSKYQGRPSDKTWGETPGQASEK